MDYLLGFVNDVGKQVDARRCTHSAHGETRDGESRSAGRGLEPGAARPGCYSAETRTLEAAMRGELKGNVARNVVWPRAPDALRPGSGIGHGTPIGGLEQDAVRPVHYSQETATWGNSWGKGRGTQSGRWLHHQPPRRGNCAATVSVRPAVAVRPEHVKAAVRLPLPSSYAAVMGKQPERVVRSNRRV